MCVPSLPSRMMDVSISAITLSGAGLATVVLVWGASGCSVALEEANAAVVARVCGVFPPTERGLGVTLRPVFNGTLDMSWVFKLVCLAWIMCF